MLYHLLLSGVALRMGIVGSVMMGLCVQIRDSSPLTLTETVQLQNPEIVSTGNNYPENSREIIDGQMDIGK